MSLWRRLAALIGGLIGSLIGLFGATTARAVDLPAENAEILAHLYSGGGVTAYGPALLVRKTIYDKVSLAGTYYVDAVSNASIDVVTQASKYHEVRSEYGLSADYVYRDVQITIGGLSSHEPDYTANAGNIDVSQEVFGGMTTISMGYTRAHDVVLKHNSLEFHQTANHWQYRLGLTQILTPRWLMSVNYEKLADDGYLGSPYRDALVFGASVPERNPTTKSANAVQLRVIGDLGRRDAMRASYRYYSDTWGVKGHTVEAGYSRYFGEGWLADSFVRYYSQNHALFYYDNEQAQTQYVSRNRQLSTFTNVGVGAKLSWLMRKVPGQYELKLNGAYEFMHFNFKDFTDVQTGNLYASNASVVQIFLSATY